MPNAIDYATGRDRPGRGGQLKPLVSAKRTRSLADVLADTEGSAWVETVGAVLEYGAALLLSPTSDGGAFSITLLDGEDRLRSYCATPEEVGECLSAVYDHCAPKGTPPTPPTTRPRKKP